MSHLNKNRPQGPEAERPVLRPGKTKTKRKGQAQYVLSLTEEEAASFRRFCQLIPRFKEPDLVGLRAVVEALGKGGE